MEQNNLDQQQFNEEESSFDIMHWVSLILHHWYLFVVCILFALGFAYLKNRTVMPTYQSIGTLIIAENRVSGTQAIMQGFGVQSGHRNVNNQIVMLSSYDFLSRVVESLPEMRVDYINRGRFKTSNLYKSSPIIIQSEYLAPEAYNYLFKIKFNDNDSFVISADGVKEENNFEIKGRFGEPIQHGLFFITINKVYNFTGRTELHFRFRNTESLIRDFMPRLGFNFVSEGSSVLGISLTSQTPERDVDFINKLCESFLDQNLDKKNDAAKRTIRFIDEQLAQISVALTESGDNLTRFRQENQIVDVSNYTSNLLGKITELDVRKAELDTQESYLNVIESYLKSNLEEGSVLVPPPLNIGPSASQLTELTQQINDVHASLNSTSKTLANPYYVQYIRDLELLKTALSEVMKSLRTSWKIQRDDIDVRSRQLKNEMNSLTNKELEMINIERKYRVDDNYLTFFLQKKAEAEIQQASNTPDNEILDKARTVAVTNSGAQSKTLIIYLLIGLLIPCLIVVLKEFLNNTVRSVKDIEKVSSFSVIGSIRHTRTSDPVLAAKYPSSSFTEMFRVIRTRIEFIAQRKTNIMISITSAESGDGKTYFGTNLASVYAMTKRKVILVDLDIRKPSVMGRFEKTATKGLTNYLIGECSLDEAITRLDGIDYDILPGGTIPPNPGEIIRSEKLKELLEQLRTVYDYIIIDTSPIGLVADAYSIVAIADVNLFIVRHEKTNKIFFKKLAQQLKIDKVENVYAVFNDVAANGNSYYVKQNSGYGYGEHNGGYGYTSNKKKKDGQKRNQYYNDEDIF